jgi:hypothetical protein
MMLMLMSRSQINVDGMIEDLAAVFDPCRDRIAEVRPNEDPKACFRLPAVDFARDLEQWSRPSGTMTDAGVRS